jgi:putative addiction module component (TIGR02574 family)
MNAHVEAVIDQARRLSTEEQLALLDALSDLITPPDAAWEAAWASECEERLAAYEQGKIEAEDFDVVMERLRKELLDR